jgi:DNA-binding XRE family transcriptional regulator
MSQKPSAKPSNKWSTLKNRMSPQARARVDARVKKTLASLPLAEIRKAVGMTQEELARQLEQGQGSVSKIENAADMYLTTLRKYVEALGGELHLTVTFAGGRSFEIDHVASLVEG